ncbi:hypothetical protein ARNL5_03199 [Anaerolineae bacterium]|nr:hypothetical protein ARNL5_03199 [Anaerolineae bacterium]
MNKNSMAHHLLIEMDGLFHTKPNPITLYLPHKRASFPKIAQIYDTLDQLEMGGYVRIYLLSQSNVTKGALRLIGAELTQEGLNYAHQNK